jgi:hypothetical protein
MKNPNTDENTKKKKQCGVYTGDNINPGDDLYIAVPNYTVG